MLIALGVSGGIGAYKAVEIARGLQKGGHDVVAVMTANATRFVGPLTFEAITRRPVILDQFEADANAKIEHIALASDIALLLIAPATANVIGKMASGVADDFLTTLYLATRAPVLVAPAMNTVMWEHPAVRANVETLAARGVMFVEPGEGFLACGWTGKGRLAEPHEVVAAAEAALGVSPSLRGRRVLVTAGPTFEDLDPIRFIGNRSSGKMGFAIAAEAARRGAAVTLVAGPTHVTPPAVAELVRVRSARDMRDAVVARADDADVAVLAAAVADYAPAERAAGKIKKSDDDLSLALRRTPDILAELGAARRATGHGPLLIGFAAETDDVVKMARGKLERKGVDLIVANDVSRSDIGFEVETNQVTLVTARGDEALPMMSKQKVAAALIDRVERMLAAGPSGARTV